MSVPDEQAQAELRVGRYRLAQAAADTAREDEAQAIQRLEDAERAAEAAWAALTDQQRQREVDRIERIGGGDGPLPIGCGRHA